jgi:hypothetical protein
MRLTLKVRLITIVVYSIYLANTRCYGSVLSCPLGRGCVRLRAGESTLDIVGNADIENLRLKNKNTISGTKKLKKIKVDVPKDEGENPIKPICHRDGR